jgi:hypothetical protein
MEDVIIDFLFGFNESKIERKFSGDGKKKKRLKKKNMMIYLWIKRLNMIIVITSPVK